MTGRLHYLYLFILASISLILPDNACAEITSAHEAIQAHREWMKVNTPSPEEIGDEELMLRILMIIDLRLKEPEAERLLIAGARKVPEVMDYINWTATLECDTLFRRTRAAFRGISEYLDRNHPGSYGARRARLWSIEGEAYFADVMKDYDNLISQQQKICSKTDSKEENALLLLMKLQRFGHRGQLEGADNQLYYPELWEIEKEVLDLYPVSSNEPAADRIALYSSLADLKAQPQEAAKVSMMFPDGFNPYDLETGFEYIGTFKDYACNSGYYYEKAIELAGKIYGEFHPLTVSKAFLLNQFRMFNTTFDSELAEHANNIINYFTLYYPSHSPEAKHALLKKGLVGYYTTGYSGLEKEAEDIIHILSLTYGDNTDFYLNSLSLITTLLLNPQSDNNSLLKRFDETCHKVAKTPVEEALWKLFVYSEFTHINPQKALELFTSLKDTYLKHADGTPVSIRLGEQLYPYFTSTTLNFDIAAEILKKLAEDNRKLFGDPSPQYFMAQKNLFITNADVKNRNELNFINNLIKEAENKQYNASNYVIRNLKEAKATFLYGGGHFDEAQKVYADIHKNIYSEDNVTALVRDALCRIYSGKDISPADEIMVKCREYADSASVNWVVPTLLIEMGDYYKERGKLNDAVAMLEKALEAHDAQLNTVDDENFNITARLANLYEATNNRAGAARLIAQDREDIVNRVHKFPSIDYLSYMNDQFGRAMRTNDMNSMFFYLVESTNTVNSLLETSDKSDDVRYLILPSFCHNMIMMIQYYHKMMAYSKEYIESEDFKKYNVDINDVAAPLTALQPQIKEMLTDLENGYPTYNPNYASDPRYTDLLTTIGAYYIFCEKDWRKGEEYFIKSQKIYHHPFELKNSYLNLAGTMDEAGNKEKADQYRSLANDLIEKYPERALESERMGALWFRFNKFMEKEDYENAEKKAREIFAKNREILDGNFQLMSTADQELTFQSLGDPAWALAALLEKKPDALAGDVFDAVVYRTGMQLRSQQELRRLVLASDNPEIRIITDSLTTLRTIRKTLNITPDKWGTQEGNADYNRNIDLSFRIQRLEQQLLDIIKDSRILTPGDVTWQMIRDCLKQGESTIEFIFSHSKIMALIVKPGCEKPKAVELCDMKDFSEQLSSLKTKNSASLARRLYGSSSSLDLYEKLWKPLESHLEDAKTIYFTAPGILHSIAFNAIATPDGKYLIDHYDLRQLSTTAQLTTDEAFGAPNSASLIGDVLFDPSQEKGAGIIPGETGERGVDEDYMLIDPILISDFNPAETDASRGLARHHFRYLPFTAKELDDISGALKGVDYQTSRRLDATEETFRNLCASSPEVLHLATHGFFLSTEHEALKVPFMRKFSSSVGSPMQRSGIALANAEQTWNGKVDLPEESDGILTASEVATLNLHNTKLVTLSACETALGGYDFEGIHGLTRGFKQAGAKSLLVSLWSVNDRSTSLFMSSFYREWLSSGDRHDAYKKAVATVREAYPSPFYWAPFIMLD